MLIFGCTHWRSHTGYLLQIKSYSEGSGGEAQLGMHMLLTLGAQKDPPPIILGFLASPDEVGHHGIHTCLYHADHTFSMQVKIYRGEIHRREKLISIKLVKKFGSIALIETLLFYGVHVQILEPNPVASRSSQSEYIYRFLNVCFRYAEVVS